MRLQELFHYFFGGRYRNRTDIKGFAVLCISHSANRPSKDGIYLHDFFTIVKKKIYFFIFTFQFYYVRVVLLIASDADQLGLKPQFLLSPDMDKLRYIQPDGLEGGKIKGRTRLKYAAL